MARKAGSPKKPVKKATTTVGERKQPKRLVTQKKKAEPSKSENGNYHSSDEEEDSQPHLASHDLPAVPSTSKWDGRKISKVTIIHCKS